MVNLRYKLYKSDKIKKVESLNLTACIIWNHITALQKRYYKIHGKYISTNKMQKHIAKLRKNSFYWKKLNSQSVQEICQRHDQSYQEFFKYCKTRKGPKKRPPTFKSFNKFKGFVFKNSGWKLENNKLIINKIGSFKFHKSRDYENVKRLNLKRDSLGDYYLTITCDIKPIKYEREGDSSIGMDFGLKQYLVISNGKEIESPQFFKQYQKDIVKANRELSKKIKGSKNRLKAKRRLAKIHKDIKNKREDFHWKLAHDLCKNNSFIAIEDLNIEAMKKLWGRKISDLSFSSFVDKLEQVAKKYNTIVQKVNRYYPSSKLCGCGVKNKALKLSDREWACPSCGVINSRDLLAANNILTEGIRLYRTKHKTSI